MEQLNKNQINALNLEQARELIEKLQDENLNYKLEIEKMTKHKISDGAKIDAVKDILSDLWCA